MNRRRFAVALAAASALVLPLAACAPGDGTTASPEELSPLTAYLSAGWGGDLDQEEQQAKFEEQQKKIEELQAQCMAELGFEYKPMDTTGGISYGGGEEWKPDDREWVSQYGYGMVNWPGRDAAPVEETELVDPNQDYVASLSESEQAAYYEALYGPSPTEEELNDDGSYEWNWETAGCSGWAQHELNGEDPWSSGEHQDLTDAINDFYAEMPNHPDLADLNAKWASCMADAGEPGFATQQEATDSISQELNAYYENQTEYIEDDPALDELGEREIALALVDLDCREKVDYRAQYQKVTYALEEQFVADHKAELDAFKADAEAGR